MISTNQFGIYKSNMGVKISVRTSGIQPTNLYILPKKTEIYCLIFFAIILASLSGSKANLCFFLLVAQTQQQNSQSFFNTNIIFLIFHYTLMYNRNFIRLLITKCFVNFQSLHTCIKLIM